MPVLILAGIEDIDIVRPLAARLLEGGGEVRCYLDDDDYQLRNMGCKLAVGSLVDEMNLEGALTNVHTFIPLFTDPVRLTAQSDLDALVDLGRRASRAASSAGIVQTILPVPAVIGTGNPLGESFSLLENEFRATLRPLCVFRIGLYWGPKRPLMAVLRGLDPGQFRGAQVGVVRIEDSVSLVSAADDREALDGVWEFGGRPHPIEKLISAAAAAGPASELSPWMREIISSARIAGSSAEQEFGVVAMPAI